MSERESAVRWCDTCEEWREHETRYQGNIATGEEHEIITCSRCGTVVERPRRMAGKRSGSDFSSVDAAILKAYGKKLSAK